tara:strand:+ start:5647 stop:6444 length:798 start_codon:yes stop_codon:yes gene_type:complete
MINITNVKDINKLYRKTLLDCLSCLIFFTILPIKIKPNKLSKNIYTLPYISLFIGIIIIVPALLISLFNPGDIILASIITVSSVLITGCLHEDGLADFMDSFGSNDKKRKIQIMNDSAIGAYGTISIVISILLRLILINHLLSMLVFSEVAIIIICVSILSRSSMLYILATLPPLKGSGLGKEANQINADNIKFIYIISAVLVGILSISFLGFNVFLVSIVTVIVSTLAITSMAWKKLGGQTGDVCGASQQISEILIYLSISLVL